MGSLHPPPFSLAAILQGLLAKPLPPPCEYPAPFLRMPGSLHPDSPPTFARMPAKLPPNAFHRSCECLQAFPGMLSTIAYECFPPSTRRLSTVPSTRPLTRHTHGEIPVALFHLSLSTPDNLDSHKLPNLCINRSETKQGAKQIGAFDGGERLC